MENRRVAVRAIILHDEKLLCVRQKNYNGNALVSGNTYWCVPGGGVDIGEPLLPALKREMIEELGVKPTIGNLLYVQQFEFKGWEHMEFFFHITNPEDYLNLDISKTTHGALELEEIDFITPAEKTILPAFLTAEPLNEHASHFTGTKFFNYLT